MRFLQGTPYLERALAILEQTVEPTAPEFIRVRAQLAKIEK